MRRAAGDAYRRGAPRSAAERGFVLIFAIAACLFLAATGTLVGRSIQSGLRSTNTAIALAKAEALANGGLAIAQARLNAQPEPAPIVCSVVDAGILALSIEDEAGKVPLNTTNAALLSALFEGLGATREDARQYVSVLADYRDADARDRPDGAEEVSYNAAGMPMAPKNADFDTVSELDRVPGIPASIRDRAKPFFTAWAPGPGLDPNVAPASLLQVLGRGVSPMSVSSLTDRPELPAAFLTPTTRTVFKIRSIGSTNGARFVRETVVIRAQQAGQGFRQLMWGQGELTAEDEMRLATRAAAPPC